MHSPRFLLPATAALLAACGIVSQPAAPPSPSAPPAKQAAAPAPAPAKPAAPTAPPKSAPPVATAKSPPVAPAKAPPVAAAKAPPVVAAAAPPIDLKSLEVKLKDSGAIGVMTKLSLKNQVDDLVAQFRAFHDGRQPPTLAQLRQPYELLLMKVMSLLQDGDPALAKALHDSRDYIWGVLADRNKFLANV